MLAVRGRVSRNRLYITLGGDLTLEEGRQLLVLCADEVRKLRPGFDIVSDISGLCVLLDPVLDAVQRAMAHLVELQRGRLVRVVGKNAGVVLQIERASKALGFEAHLAFSLEEADRLLDGELT